MLTTPLYPKLLYSSKLSINKVLLFMSLMVKFGQEIYCGALMGGRGRNVHDNH